MEVVIPVLIRQNLASEGGNMRQTKSEVTRWDDSSVRCHKGMEATKNERREHGAIVSSTGQM